MSGIFLYPMGAICETGKQTKVVLCKWSPGGLGRENSKFFTTGDLRSSFLAKAHFVVVALLFADFMAAFEAVEHSFFPKCFF